MRAVISVTKPLEDGDAVGDVRAPDVRKSQRLARNYGARMIGITTTPPPRGTHEIAPSNVPAL